MNSSILFNATNATLPSKGPSTFPVEYRIVATVLHVLIFSLGFCGNIATIHVVRKTKNMHTPTYCYLVSLAVADLMVLLSAGKLIFNKVYFSPHLCCFAVPEQIVSHHLYRGQWVFGQAGCSILVFTNFLGINASSTSICCFTIERYIGICHPLWAQKVCSVERAKKIIIGIWVFAILYCSHWLGLTLIQTYKYVGYPELQACGFRLPRDVYVYFFLADIFLFYVIPLLIAIVLYTRIGMVLNASVKSDLRKNLPTIATGLGAIASGKSAPPPPVPKDNSLFQVVRMLLVVVTSFAILWLPYRGLLVYNSFATKKFLNVWYLLFAKSSIYLNSAINPVLYNILSKRFREAFMARILPLLYPPKWRNPVRSCASPIEMCTTSSFCRGVRRCLPRRRGAPTNNKETSSLVAKSSPESSKNVPPNLATAPEIVPLLPKDPEEWSKTIIFV